MLILSIFPALHLYLSDTVKEYPIPVGMRGLRHKPRHNRSRISALQHFEANPSNAASCPTLDNSLKLKLAPACCPTQGLSPNATTDFRLSDLEKN
jgi:hypothetical protein